jgi:hypothetical protein
MYQTHLIPYVHSLCRRIEYKHGYVDNVEFFFFFFTPSCLRLYCTTVYRLSPFSV